MAIKRVNRGLTVDECAIVRKLVTASGRNDLANQLPSLLVVGEYPPDDPTIILQAAGQAPSKPVPRVTIEGVVSDRLDAGEVGVILHVVNQLIDELEFFRYDGKPVNGLPDPGQVRPLAR